MVSPSLALLAFWSITTSAAGISGSTFPRQDAPNLLGNTSVLPPGWSGVVSQDCFDDCAHNEEPLVSEFLFGPNFTDPVGLTIESCVAFCDQQGSRMAGLKGTECRCGNIFNPSACFETVGSECIFPDTGESCPGNPVETCGSASIGIFSIFFKSVSQFSCSEFLWPGGAPLTPGAWRFSYFYNDSVSARALPHNAVNLPVPLPRGNLTVEACVAACGNAGFTLAGVEFADECCTYLEMRIQFDQHPDTYQLIRADCGNALQSNSKPITDCSVLPSSSFPNTRKPTLMKCKGNANEFCGGPDIISIYTLAGTGLLPLISFNSELDNFCAGIDCIGIT
ncbi:hypothetical protein GALMADRAFT_137589 [Galerina marginata CBS 339.88]|uniref:WSC domain-containing protein n=1 Tax=Galerina marginata (strain CBS 339.88) TaxID=685588 RepID=A0A067T863_GALM3|nr:hypothetical protein GALMADRAFT_137589 [Galerina marginata CBS 339.88]